MKSDIIYDVSKMLVKADQSTNHKQLRYVYPISTPSGSWAAPLKQEAIDFDIRNETSARIRFDTSLMFFELFIRNEAPDGATPPLNAVMPPNLIALLINELSLKFNDGSDLVFNKDKSTFLHHFNSTLLRTFPLETINKRGDCLFTPIGSSRYTSAIADAKEFDPDSILTAGGEPIGKFPLALAVAGNSSALTDLDASARPLEGLQKERFNNYFATDASPTHLKPIQVAVPFGLLFGISGIIQNMIRMMIRLTLNVDGNGTATNLCEHVSAGSKSAIRVARVWIGLDQYVPNVSETMNQITDKKEGSNDILTYFDSDVKSISLTSGGSNEVVFTGVKDLQSILLYQVARGMTNGKADANIRTYSSSFEFFIGNNIAPNGKIIERSDHAGTAGCGIPIDDIQMEYGSILYPQQPLKTYVKDSAGNAVFTPNALFQEYLKCTGRGPSFDQSSGTNFVDYNLFSKTMPFIMLSPWSSNGVHLTKEAKNLTIKLNKDNALTSENFTLVITRLRTITIAPDTSVLVSA